MQSIKRFIKELKRVRWPSVKVANSTFFKSVLFISLAGLFMLIITIVFTLFWNAVGAGL